jgi:hypothetical protein
MHLQKNLRRLFLTLLAVALLGTAVAHFLSKYIEKKATEILLSIPIKVSSLDANVLTRSIELNDVNWTHANDSLPQFPHHLVVKQIRLEGIGVYQLLTNKKLHIHKILLDVGEFQFNRSLKNNKSNLGERKVDVQGITVDRIVLKDVFTTISEDSVDQYQGMVNLSLENVGLKDVNSAREITSYAMESCTALVTHITIPGQGEMYTTRIARLYLNSADREVEIDSVVIIPKYSKFRFARKIGRQVSRMNVLVPKITIHELSFSEIKDSVFRAATIEIKSAKLSVYRDKRFPFLKKETTPLPIAMIRAFKFGIAVDSIKLIDADITYEEFPEKGYHSGQITFKKLNASLAHLTNRDHFPDREQATLKATSYLMGKGLIKAEFSLPYTKAQIYNAKGSLGNLALYRLNPMLENIAFMSVTSGKLNELSFNFDYTDLKSKGSVLINYEDLKINSLTKEKDSEKNEFMSFVVNTILKKDKNEDLDKGRRVGTVDFERDRRRAIFHYWWHSVLTGIKSTALDSPKKKEKEKEKDMDREKKRKKGSK